MEEKINIFNDLCASWIFRNIDMTEPYLGYIEVSGNVIKYFCEKYISNLDDCVTYNPGYIVNEKLVKQIESLHFNNREEVLNIIDRIESSIDWKKVKFELDILERKAINKVNNKDYVR